MLALIVMAATLPSLLCFGSSAFLAYRDKSQWMWFAGFALVAGYGGILLLSTIGAWRLAVHG
ncbi:MAG: hypothetical protein ABI561_20895 [Bradyrhizobium sp.]